MSSPSHPALQQLHDLDRSLPEFHDRLSDILYGEEYRKCVYEENNQKRTLNLQGGDLVWLVDYLDKALDGLDSSSPVFRKYLRELKTICGASGILPSSYTLSSSTLKIGPKPSASGGFGDVYEGTLNGLTVCVKRVRVYTSYPQQAAKTFCQEAVMWKRLTHPNIVSLLGVTIDPFQLISDWMPGGDLPKYIKENPNVDRLGLLSDATEGLCYLHSCNVIHGDLKGPNILVDNSGRVRLADFGLATVTQNPNSMQIASVQRGYTPGWTAPEILKEEEGYSKKADIFSLAMVTIEVFTGASPFSNPASFATALAIVEGKRPQQPTHPTFTEDLWALVRRCWDQDPRLRPEVPEVLNVLRSLSGSHPFLQQLRRLDSSLSGFHDQLTKVLYGEDYQQHAPNLQSDDLVWLIDYLDKAFDGLDPASPASRKCLRELRSICGTRMTLPTSYIIPSHLLDIEPDPFASGGFRDVYHGTFDGSRVLIEHVRTYTRFDPQKATKSFYQEAVIWKRLAHPNILPFLGVTIDPLRLISNRVTGGSLQEYIKKHPDADRLGLLLDLAKGLCYLHSCGVVHGDLKGARSFSKYRFIILTPGQPNVLVDDSGHVHIWNFDVAKVTRNLDSVRSASNQRGYTMQWTAPEVLNGGESSKESDVFSFAIVMIEVFTGAIPFGNVARIVAAFSILEGKRPLRPSHPTFTADLWTLTQRCWDQDPHLRPEASEVLQTLLTLSSDVDRVVKIATDDKSIYTASGPSLLFQRSGDGLPVPPQGLPRREATSVSGSPATDNENSPPASLRPGGSGEGWAGRVARDARKTIKSIVRKFPGLRPTR